MNEVKNDIFYDYIKQYDSDCEYHFVGEVEYHLLKSDKPYEGLQSHRKALIAVFERLYPLTYDIDKAQPTSLDTNAFFYCPDVINTDYHGNAIYDAEWKPNDDNFGTTVPYWYALMEPIHGKRKKPDDFKKINEILFPNGTDILEIYEWTTDWSEFFDDGHEWYGACCYSIYDKSMDRYVVVLVSATD
jgi:hypothetical protein